MRTSGSTTRTIAAQAHVVWSLLTDITRMGEWSPDCIGCSWLDGASGPAVGVTFEGRNRDGEFTWETICEVTECDPGRSFAYLASGMTTWRYTVEPSADGGSCTVTESYDAPFMADPPDYLVPNRDDLLDAATVTTLERVAAVAEMARLKPTKDAIDLGIVIRDSGASLKFYRDTLGFTHVGDLPMPGSGRGVMHWLLCGTTVIKLVKFDKVPAASNPLGGLGGASGYRYFTVSVDDLAGIAQRASDAGYRVPVKPGEIRPGVTIAMIEDPDGNWVELLQMANG